MMRMLLGWTIMSFIGSVAIMGIGRFLFGGIAGGAVNTIQPIVGIATWSAITAKLGLKSLTSKAQDMRHVSSNLRDRLDSSANRDK